MSQFIQKYISILVWPKLHTATLRVKLFPAACTVVISMLLVQNSYDVSAHSLNGSAVMARRASSALPVDKNGTR